MGTTPETRPAPPPLSRLVIARTDAERVIHVQDVLTLRNPDYAGDVVEITIGGRTSHIGVLADEAVIVVTVRRGEQCALAGGIVTLMGPLQEGGGR